MSENREYNAASFISPNWGNLVQLEDGRWRRVWEIGLSEEQTDDGVLVKLEEDLSDDEISVRIRKEGKTLQVEVLTLRWGWEDDLIIWSYYLLRILNERIAGISTIQSQPREFWISESRQAHWQDIKAFWGDGLVSPPDELLTSLPLSDLVRQFLREVGLPVDARLTDSSYMQIHFKPEQLDLFSIDNIAYVLLGYNQSGLYVMDELKEFIALRVDNGEVHLTHTNFDEVPSLPHPLFFNSNLWCFLRFFREHLQYLEYIEPNVVRKNQIINKGKLQQEDRDELNEISKINKQAFYELKYRLKAIDPPAMKAVWHGLFCFWYMTFMEQF